MLADERSASGLRSPLLTRVLAAVLSCLLVASVLWLVLAVRADDDDDADSPQQAREAALIAAVAGPAVGFGTTLLLLCDLVYAGDNAAFSMPFVNLGLCPEAASSLLLPRLMGYQRAAEALLLGEPFMAEAALEAGLVNRVVPPTEVNGVAQAQAAKLAAKPLSALMATKRLMKAGQRAEIKAQMAEEGQSFGRMLTEPAAREAFTAFMEKRKPDFSQC